MTIEGLGKKFQDARRARNLTLDEAARMTKIRPQRLAEIESDDFSQFPSLAYAKGFLLIYGKFLDVDVTPYLGAFEDSESVTVDGYSYLQESERAKPVSAPVTRRRAAPSVSNNRVSPMPLIVGVVVLVIGFFGMKFLLNVQRLAPGKGQATAQMSPSSTPALASSGASPVGSTNVNAAPTIAPAASPVPPLGPPETRKALAVDSSAEPEVRKAKPVTKEDLKQGPTATNSPSSESSEQNRVAIRPLKRTYVRVTLGDEGKPAFERWVSPADGPVEFHGKHVSIRVLDRESVAITKNGQALQENDQDVTVN
ncbi:MAG TPA: helix-turn-helix domain-containing protein [Candidatus Udaeobacter sp.]|jgi:cytoskeletal protein RodZ